ncbi:hypothetical protein EYF80_067573 [Liparis tanakae]|uniref:Uncharacterized protein n=1 Tax=Liparis tanakae TaxID=230148 RepID=A0A4Z2E0L5_9TELE|nr:hypothetical protein EYF80_067573 [Liparis tanakae]
MDRVPAVEGAPCVRRLARGPPLAADGGALCLRVRTKELHSLQELQRQRLPGGPDPTSRSGRHQQEVRPAEQAGRRRHDAPAAANQLHP